MSDDWSASERLSVRLLATAVGFGLLGPWGAYAGWKAAGFAITKNPLVLVPLGGVVFAAADVIDAVTTVGDVADAASAVADASDATSAVSDISDTASFVGDAGIPPSNPMDFASAATGTTAAMHTTVADATDFVPSTTDVSVLNPDSSNMDLAEMTNGNVGDENYVGQRPTDIQGNLLNRNVQGNVPADIWGKPMPT